MENKKIINFINSIRIEDLESFIEQKKKSFKVKIFLIIFSLICIIFGGPMGIFFILILYFSIFKGLKFYISQGKFMKNYALSHNFNFQNTMDTTSLKGRLFENDTKTVFNILTTVHEEYPIKIFNYNYSTGGKNSITYHFTVSEIEIKNLQFPHIFLKSNSMIRYLSQDIWGQNKDTEIKLDSRFEKDFNLYCTQNYEIEVLQIFTPEVLELLKREASHFSIEFVSNKIYIYDDTTYKTEKEIDQLFMVTKKILDSSGPLLKRLQDDFEALHMFSNKS